MTTSTTRNLVLVVTGAATSAHVPYWINWLTVSRPDVRVRILMTGGASRFLTTASLSSPSVDEVRVDSWDAAGDHPLHVELAGWADGLLVYPASQSYLSDLAHDRADRPSLLVAQLLGKPVVVSPGLPPGGLESGAVRRSWHTLERERIARVVPPVPGVSKHDPALTSWAPGSFARAVDVALDDRGVDADDAPDGDGAPAEDAGDAAGRLGSWFAGVEDSPLLVSARIQFDMFLGELAPSLSEIVLRVARTVDTERLEAASARCVAGDGTGGGDGEPSELGVAAAVLAERDRIVRDGWSTARFAELCDHVRGQIVRLRSAHGRGRGGERKQKNKEKGEEL